MISKEWVEVSICPFIKSTFLHHRNVKITSWQIKENWCFPSSSHLIQIMKNDFSSFPIFQTPVIRIRKKFVLFWQIDGQMSRDAPVISMRNFSLQILFSFLFFSSNCDSKENWSKKSIFKQITSLKRKMINDGYKNIYNSNNYSTNFLKEKKTRTNFMIFHQ